MPPPISKPQPASNFSGWENEEDEWGLDDITTTAKPSSNKFNPESRYAKNHELAQVFDGKLQPRDNYNLDPIDYDSLDLNKLSNEELAKHKKKMDKIYEKNFVKPGDPNFVYDKRKQF